ncbi:CTLH/CRA C-terminal to lish motif domain-containing protein [Glomus cerebriforme]|uniref:GID complex catalytic subunit 2 n=1 Tax=Glomus cerebriforme TaxID=658196 RepID=A0A397S874_9GLOM|nr:CTLH/CRA C-terminal to lish motif domain-containing protein [Glomus cerebriforme]
MDPISKEFSKVEKKQQEVADLTIDNIDKIINEIREAQKRLETDPASIGATLNELEQKFKELTAKTLESHKELQKVIVRYEKIVDKKWKNDITIASNPEVFADKEKVLNTTVALHFIREGRFELANTFIKEAQLDIPDTIQTQFHEMYQILGDIKLEKLESAIEWARSKSKELEKRGSTLEFELHRQRYVQLLIDDRREEALAYARKKFPLFHSRHIFDIKRLMCALAFSTRLLTSPYKDLLSSDLWIELQNKFMRDFCNLLGMSSESPLYISVTVGATALPTILKMATIMKEKKNEWSQQDELPVEVPLPDYMRYHSIFACPVSKEQSTEKNPPMMLPCGHVICQESLNKLSRGNSRFKCPYCPHESTANQALRIYF